MDAAINWDKIDGLLPVVAQDESSGEVLMLAYMNQEAFELSMSSGLAHYYSRTKGRIWQKGEESGNIQVIKSICVDCDGDALLIKVAQSGPACHTGERSCFFNDIATKEPKSAPKSAPKYDILDELYHTALKRKLQKSESSYIAKLYKKAPDSYLKKICEESGEFALAIKDLERYKIYKDLGRESFGEHESGNPKGDAIYEAADVLFHIIVALADFDIHPSQILAELKRRQGVSGIEEKNSREN